MSQQIKDSGRRTEFDTGAVRDIQSGKGRFDLLPMATLNDLYGNAEVYPYLAVWALARHFEAGCKKYGERNWEKGITISTYYNSAWRHLTKELRGWTDEPHCAALAWNLVCMLWTIDKINMGVLPQELWDLPFPNKGIDIHVTKAEPIIKNLLHVCGQNLVDYIRPNTHSITSLKSATIIALDALEYKERKTNGPQ